MRRAEGLAARRHERLLRHAERCDRVDRRLATARIVAALVLLAGFATAWWRRDTGLPLAVACTSLAVFAGLAHAHGRVRRRLVRARGVAEAAGRDERRANGRWRDLPAGPARELAAPGREADLADDLALLGPGSLGQLVSRCATPWGERRLASLLLAAEAAPDLASRQEAARELARLGTFRRRFEAEGRAVGEAARDALGLARELARPSWLDARPWVPVVAVLLALATCGQIVAAGAWGASTLAWPTLALNVALTAWLSRRLVPEYEPLLDREGPVTACAAMLVAVERRTFRAPALAAWRAVIAEPSASRALDELAAILGSLSLRRNVLWWPVQALLLWDAWQAARLARWRRTHGARVEAWLRSLAEIEAVASLAAHAELWGGTFPEVDAAGPAFEARALAHPLLPPGKAVANDLALGGESRLLLLTGSNMSGKSTLLRAAGLNAVLALAGGPVQAASLRMRPCRVLTSIRVSDALDEGVSLFYAEVRRLKAVVTAAEDARDGAAPPVLFLVDEILRGTNTRERHLAARAIIARLAATGSWGIVTSHDIELTALEGAVPGVRNGHFREEVREGRMTFDYRLRPGPVTSTNALAILKLEGLEIPPE